MNEPLQRLCDGCGQPVADKYYLVEKFGANYSLVEGCRHNTPMPIGDDPKIAGSVACLVKVLFGAEAKNEVVGRFCSVLEQSHRATKRALRDD